MNWFLSKWNCVCLYFIIYLVNRHPGRGLPTAGATRVPAAVAPDAAEVAGGAEALAGAQALGGRGAPEEAGVHEEAPVLAAEAPA